MPCLTFSNLKLSQFKGNRCRTNVLSRILMNTTVRGIRLLFLGCLTFIFSASLVSQTTAGRIRGSVRDTTGAVMTGATVTITDEQRATSRVVTTDDTGTYVAPNLPPGVYKLVATAKGFKSVERRNIAVEVATDLALDFDLAPGS